MDLLSPRTFAQPPGTPAHPSFFCVRRDKESPMMMREGSPPLRVQVLRTNGGNGDSGAAALWVLVVCCFFLLLIAIGMGSSPQTRERAVIQCQSLIEKTNRYVRKTVKGWKKKNKKTSVQLSEHKESTEAEGGPPPSAAVPPMGCANQAADGASAQGTNNTPKQKQSLHNLRSKITKATAIDRQVSYGGSNGEISFMGAVDHSRRSYNQEWAHMRNKIRDRINSANPDDCVYPVTNASSFVM